MQENKEIICYKCQKELVMEKVNFSYLGHNFHADILKCPVCGEVYISEALVRGRMTEVEMLMEDK